ncbi:MAG: phosphoglycerate kinase [Candidatus Kapaibacterium sp.]
MASDTYDIPRIQDVDLRGKVVLVRVDHNVVKKGVIQDPFRIESTYGTLFYLNAKGAKIILMSHVGRPRNKKTGEITIDESTSVGPIVEYLEDKLHINFEIPEFYKDEKKGYIGIETNINHLLRDLKEDKIDGIYLPNTRWFWGEEAKGEDAERFANQLAGLADIYVNDAFGSWRPHASTYDVAKYLPHYAGYLMQKEIKNLRRIYQPERPFVAVVAGAKFDTKIDTLKPILDQADYLVMGGVMYNVYMAAKYGLKIKGVSEEDKKLAKGFIEDTKQHKDKIIELPYVIESETMDEHDESRAKVVKVDDLSPGSELNYILDISKKSFETQKVRDVFSNARTIFVNAVMGYTPHFNEGTIALDELIHENKQAMKYYAGGDTLHEFKRLLPGLYFSVKDDKKYYLFTGGGAVLKAIQEGTPMGMEPIKILTE